MLYDIALVTGLWIATSWMHLAVPDMQIPITLHCFVMNLTVMLTSWPASLIGYLLFLYLVLNQWWVDIPVHKCQYFDGFWWAIAFAVFMFPCLHWLTIQTWPITLFVMNAIYFSCGIRYHKDFRDEIYWLDHKSFRALLKPHVGAWLVQYVASLVFAYFFLVERNT